MRYKRCRFPDRSGIGVSAIGFGASALGGVFGEVKESRAIKAVHAALDCGINYFDVAPAYGQTRSETVLGKALKGIPRDRYLLSTKAGKQATPGGYAADVFDFSRSGILKSLDESRERLGVDYFDIVHLHDIEYDGGQLVEQALSEGLEALAGLKQKGEIGGVSVGTYPIELCRRIIRDCPVDTIMIHNHYCLNDTMMLDLVPLAKEKGVGLINASPFAMGLLSDREAPFWHPAKESERDRFRQAADFCRSRGTTISKLAIQFSTRNPDIPITVFSTSRPEAVKLNIEWANHPYDPVLVEDVQRLLGPLFNKDWDFANTIGR
jgi:aryl-alcohol dehydrogenase-like predicted oxidoreductase